MASDIQAIEQVLQSYFDGLYEGDTKKLASAFHEVSHLYSVDEQGGVKDLPRTQWLEAVNGRPSPKSNELARTDRVVSIQLLGPELAYAKVECSIHPRHFTDALTLLNLKDSGWKIVSKSFRTDVKG